MEQVKPMLNVMIVDDEPPAQARLGQVLRDCSERVSVQLVGEADGGIQGLEEADRLQPDPRRACAGHERHRGRAPFGAEETTRRRSCLSPPTTSTRWTRLRVQALDYLMKPVRADRLVAALTRAERFRTTSRASKSWRKRSARCARI